MPMTRLYENVTCACGRPAQIKCQCDLCYAKAYRAKRPEYYQYLRRKSALKTKFGMTIDDYERLLEKQNGVCAICLRGERKNKRLSVDHDHATKRIRGLLCNDCNTKVLPLADADMNVLYRLREYLCT